MVTVFVEYEFHVFDVFLTEDGCWFPSIFVGYGKVLDTMFKRPEVVCFLLEVVSVLSLCFQITVPLQVLVVEMDFFEVRHVGFKYVRGCNPVSFCQSAVV